MSEWQPIDTAPRDGTKIVMVDASHYVDIAKWSDRLGRWIPLDAQGYMLTQPQPTHWMPLPEPPKGATK